MPTFSEFANQVGGTAGTAIDAAHLDALVVAQSCLISGTTPGTSATLTLTVGQQEVVVNTGALATYLKVAATTLTMANNATNYVDVSNAGSYTITTSTSVTANSLRLWQVTASAGAITAVALLATTAPIGGSMVQTGTASGVAGLDAATNLIVPSGHRLVAPGQTGAATGVTSVANQAVGAVSIANGTPNGAVATLTNSLINLNSHIFLQPSNTGAYTAMVQSCVLKSVGSGVATFYVFTNGGSGVPTSGPTDVVYQIIN